MRAIHASREMIPVGLSMSHNAWQSTHSTFNEYRHLVAQAAGIPLPLMYGWYEAAESLSVIAQFLKLTSAQAPATDEIGTIVRLLPLSWDILRPDAVHPFLMANPNIRKGLAVHHLEPLAARLQELVPAIRALDDKPYYNDWEDKTVQLINGLRNAASKNEMCTFC